MANNVDKIISLSEKKKELLNKILELTKEQKQLIINEDLDNLSIILEDKQALMDKIDLMDKEFIGLYESLKEEENISSFDQIDIKKYNNIKELKDLVSEINSILTETSTIDKENKKQMKVNIKNVKSNIKNVKKGKKAYKGYNYEISNTILIDEKK